MPTEQGDPSDRTTAGRLRARGLFEGFPHGLLLVGEERRVLSLNPKARALLALRGRRPGSGAWTCCELVCRAVQPPARSGGPCLTQRALEAGGPPFEVEIEVGGEGDRSRVVASVSRVEAEDVRVLFQLRLAAHESAGGGADRGTEDRRLRVETLGRTRVEVAGGPVEGDWIGQRPGLLLKYLVCRRHEMPASDQIGEALWPGADPRDALTSLRHCVHVLRGKLEPECSRRASPSFIRTHPGGYSLDPDRVWIDAEELEERVLGGLRLLAEGRSAAAVAMLEAAMHLHRGEYLAEEADADWVVEERERLHDLVARAYAALIEATLASGDLEAAAQHSRRLADLEPLDADIQRQLIEICLRQGRRSDAVRRYALFRERTRREFGEEPGFTLAELEA